GGGGRVRRGGRSLWSWQRERVSDEATFNLVVGSVGRIIPAWAGPKRSQTQPSPPSTPWIAHLRLFIVTSRRSSYLLFRMMVTLWLVPSSSCALSCHWPTAMFFVLML